MITKINWNSLDFYSVEDLERVRDNLKLMAEEIHAHNLISSSVPLQDVGTPRGTMELPTPQLINELEVNLQAVYNALGVPFTEWQDSKTWYPRLDSRYKSNPTFADWNRWEILTKRIKETLDFLDNYLYNIPSGTMHSGGNRVRYYFSRGG